jgi:hypothetical protein
MRRQTEAFKEQQVGEADPQKDQATSLRQGVPRADGGHHTGETTRTKVDPSELLLLWSLAGGEVEVLSAESPARPQLFLQPRAPPLKRGARVAASLWVVQNRHMARQL